MFTKANEEMMYPIKVTLSTGTVLTVHSSRDTIECFYGDVNKLVNESIKPLKDVRRVEVLLYDADLEDFVTEVSYDAVLEAWKEMDVRVVITYDFNTIEEEERGYIGRKDGWLPCYTLRTVPKSKKAYSMITEDIVRIRSARLVNREARNKRNLDSYYKNPQKANQVRMTRYYMNHEEEKRRNAEAGKRWRLRQRNSSSEAYV